MKIIADVGHCDRCIAGGGIVFEGAFSLAVVTGPGRPELVLKNIDRSDASVTLIIEGSEEMDRLEEELLEAYGDIWTLRDQLDLKRKNTVP